MLRILRNLLNKETDMTSFLAAFASLGSAKNVLSALESLGSTLAQEYMKDQNARNAVIDTAISYLQSLKTQG